MSSGSSRIRRTLAVTIILAGTISLQSAEKKTSNVEAGKADFNTQDFRLTPVLTFPKVEFASKNLFADEAAHVVWINVNGDLLRADLPK